jgi:hypothetical protein
MSVANCPSCGALIDFAIGSSEVVVCNYCRSIVARTDRGLENHGKVAALIDTGSPLRVGTDGRYRNMPFRLTGRTQLRHQAGGVWDEWYGALADGRWLWLAEAQGRFYVTFKTASPVPPANALQLGDRILDNLTVAEIGEAQLISAEGELPWTPDAGYSYRYADLTGDEGRFATIDYSEEPPVLFKGTETTLAELGISGEAARTSRVATKALNCSQCGGALELVAPDKAERIFCPYCGAAHDITAGRLEFFKKLKKSHVQPIIPLGSKGTMDGDEYVVAGFMERAVRFDMDYFWTEYLLYNAQKGYRWLVHSDQHWSFATPLRPGEVLDSEPRGAAKTVAYEGQTYKLFQNATARVTHVIGEFYWKVTVGEQVDTVDYIRPPFGISKELTRSGAQEIAYSHARYVERKEIEEAFGVQGLNRPTTIGPMQPFRGAKLGGLWALMMALLFVTALVLGFTRPRRVVMEKAFDLSEAPIPEGAPENARVVFTEPFELSGKNNVEVTVRSGLSSEWLYSAVDLVNDATGKMQSFDMGLEYYSGTSGGESWSEGDRDKTVILPRPEKGRYVLRFESSWERGKRIPPPLNVRVREGVFRFLHFVLAAIALSILPLFAVIRQVSFESARWKDSAHSPFGQVDSGDDEDEE